jgi:hypothetical protein
MAAHDMAMHDMVVHGMALHDVAVPGMGINKMWNFLSSKNLIFDAHFRGEMPMFSYYMLLNNILKIKRLNMIENIKTTLLTHP